MPTTETAITFIAAKKLVKTYGSTSKARELQAAVDADFTGIVFVYAKGDIRFQIKRYRTGNFIKKTF